MATKPSPVNRYAVPLTNEERAKLCYKACDLLTKDHPTSHELKDCIWELQRAFREKLAEISGATLDSDGRIVVPRKPEDAFTSSEVS